MITSAGNALYQRNPTMPPMSAAPMMARSSFVRLRCDGIGLERTYDTTIIAMKVKRAMIPVPAASPSTPSARFVPFDPPAMTRKRNGYQPHDSGTETFAIGM